MHYDTVCGKAADALGFRAQGFAGGPGWGSM